MLFKKEKPNLIIHRIDLKMSGVKCENCKHRIDREDAHEVKKQHTVNQLISGYQDQSLFFCKLCKPPYDLISVWHSDKCPCYTVTRGLHIVVPRCYVHQTTKTYHKRIPAHLVEVTEKGKEIKMPRKKKGGKKM